MKRSALRSLGLYEDFTRDDVLNASAEDAAIEHSTAVKSLHEVTEKRTRGNAALRHSISIAKDRTSSFADFERFMNVEAHKKYVRRNDK